MIGNSIGEKKEKSCINVYCSIFNFCFSNFSISYFFGLNASNFLLGIMGSDAEVVLL